MTAPNKPEGLEMTDELIDDAAEHATKVTKGGMPTSQQWRREFARELLSASKPAAPQSFKVWAMQEGLISESHGVRFVNSVCDVAQKAWNAALAAAPAAPAQSGEAVTLGQVKALESAVCNGQSGEALRLLHHMRNAIANPQPSPPVEAGETCPVKCSVGKYSNSDPCSDCPNAAVLLDDERAALLSDHIELNMCNYDPDDVASLNAWAIRAYDLIARAASPQATASTATGAHNG